MAIKQQKNYYKSLHTIPIKLSNPTVFLYTKAWNIRTKLWNIYTKAWDIL